MDRPDERPNYQPLVAVLGTALLASFALQAGEGSYSLMLLMTHFMGLFFLLLAMFKLFNVKAFANGFAKYDLLAKRTRLYAYAYPFIELMLGLLYLSGQYPVTTNALTLAVMAISAAGVVQSVRRGYQFKCACLGTVLNVPLSTVSIIENAGMGLMALGMLVFAH